MAKFTIRFVRRDRTNEIDVTSINEGINFVGSIEQAEQELHKSRTKVFLNKLVACGGVSSETLEALDLDKSLTKNGLEITLPDESFAVISCDEENSHKKGLYYKDTLIACSFFGETTQIDLDALAGINNDTTSTVAPFSLKSSSVSSLFSGSCQAGFFNGSRSASSCRVFSNSIETENIFCEEEKAHFDEIRASNDKALDDEYPESLTF